ncbi:MAG: VPLPA-CTERM sorting domain-containing protein [Parvularculaceae bacterium]|nr:VPLPA-CTERM sorting domain-containing protein [Parvularculaceae bacterium]
MKNALIAAATAATMAFGVSNAAEVSLGFEGLPASDFTGVFMEDGYTITAVDMFGDTQNGTDGPKELERLFGTNGFLSITRAAPFNFKSIDFEVEFSSSATVTVEGYLDGMLQGTEVFALGVRDLYTTFVADVLAGVSLDRLVILAERQSGALTSFDRVVLDDVGAAPVPVPAALPLMAAGLAGLGALRRRKKS